MMMEYTVSEEGKQKLKEELDYLKGWSQHTENRDTDSLLNSILIPSSHEMKIAQGVKRDHHHYVSESFCNECEH